MKELLCCLESATKEDLSGALFILLVISFMLTNKSLILEERD